MALESHPRMFKSRTGSQGNSATHPPQSIEAVRRRARHRLIGAAVLVALGVLGFPLLFDTQPRPISLDIPIEIPAKNPAPPLQAAKTAPSNARAEPAAPAEPKPPAPAPTAGVTTNESLSAREEVVEPVRTAPPPAKPEPAAKPAAPAPDAAKASATEAARAKALLEGMPAEAAERIVVQVGAFADATRAREARLKLERAGLKTYTHVAETPEGKRIRVRVGPFASKAEADKAAARVKALGLPAAILTL